MPKVDLIEQETIIIFNREEKDAFIFTYESLWKRKLKALGCEQVFDNGYGGLEFKIDKSRIQLPRKPRVSKPLSEAKKKALVQRLTAGRKASKTLDNTRKNKQERAS